MARNSFGFTLIELLVVIAIISLLSSAILASIGGAREDARGSQTIVDLKDVRALTTQYSIDTGQFPLTCRVQTPCTASNDPLLNKLGISGWDGPYGRMYDRTHGWGGHIGFERQDADGDSEQEFFIILDDDPPGALNDAGKIPQEALEKIDEQIDGDTGLNSGNFQADIWGISTGDGSAIFIQKR